MGVGPDHLMHSEDIEHSGAEGSGQIGTGTKDIKNITVDPFADQNPFEDPQRRAPVVIITPPSVSGTEPEHAVSRDSEVRVDLVYYLALQ